MTPSISRFRIGDLMRSLEIEFAPIARARGVELTFVPSSLPVESDRLLLRRLLQNLISNAIKYTPQGRVLVGCRRRGTSLQIGVYDTGVGIPVQKRGEIFKEFHRLEQGARIARGLGLGLSIVQAACACARPWHRAGFQSQRRLALLGDGAGRRGGQSHGRRDQRDAAVERADGGTLIVCIDNDPAILDGMQTLLTAGVPT